jgi:hypothetical protein
MKMPIAVSNIFAANSKLAVAIVAGAALLTFVPTANAVTFSTSGAATMYGLGDTLNTQFDVLQVDAGAGSLVANIRQSAQQAFTQELMRWCRRLTTIHLASVTVAAQVPNVASAI